MVTLGYKLMSEEHGPKELLRNAPRAEQAGFEFAAIAELCDVLDDGGSRSIGADWSKLVRFGLQSVRFYGSLWQHIAAQRQANRPSPWERVRQWLFHPASNTPSSALEFTASAPPTTLPSN